MQIIVVIGVKFQMLIAANLLKTCKIEFFLLSTTLLLRQKLANRRNSFELMVLSICLLILCYTASSYVSYIDNSCLVQLVGRRLNLLRT